MSSKASKTGGVRRWERAFLAVLAETANVSVAASAVGIARNTAYTRRNSSVAFRALWDDAVARSVDMLEEEARRRAAVGVDEPVFYQGQPCGVIRRYSDTLLIFLLKAHRPEKYRENVSVQHSGAIDLLGLAGATDDELAARARGADRELDAALPA